MLRSNAFGNQYQKKELDQVKTLGHFLVLPINNRKMLTPLNLSNAGATVLKIRQKDLLNNLNLSPVITDTTLAYILNRPYLSFSFLQNNEH